MKILSVEYSSILDNHGQITVKRWWQSRPRTYVGNGTVWHDAETGRRPGTNTEAALTNAMWRYEYAVERYLQENNP